MDLSALLAAFAVGYLIRGLVERLLRSQTSHRLSPKALEAVLSQVTTSQWVAIDQAISHKSMHEAVDLLREVSGIDVYEGTKVIEKRMNENQGGFLQQLQYDQKNDANRK